MKKKSFWDWSNHIFIKLICCSLLCNLLIDTKIMFLMIIGGIIGIIGAFYGIFILSAVLFGCFVVIPNSDKAKDILEAEAKARKKEDKILEEYGRIDSFDNDK